MKLSFKTALTLGRVSSLPTIWSNLLAGWVLGGGGFDLVPLIQLVCGGSFLYVGGTYLNDYCDAEFDAKQSAGRPIPAGSVSRMAVAELGGLWIVIGFTSLASLGGMAALTALVLTGAMLTYDFRHRTMPHAPLVLGLCRFLLYPLGALAAGGQGISTFASYLVPAGLALGLYVAGITYFVRGERRAPGLTRWPLFLLVVPIVVALGLYTLENAVEPFPFMPVLLVCLLQLDWMAWVLVPFWRNSNPFLERVAGGLVAGIVLADMVLTTVALGPLAVFFYPLFVLTLLLQRMIPAA